MALGVLSYASQVRLVSPWIPSPVQQLLSVPVQIILAQADRDQAVDDLLKKLEEVYGFMTQDKTLDQIESMHNVVAQIAQQTLECARFIRDYYETKNFCESATS